MLKRLLSLFKKPTQAIDAEEPDFGEEDWGSDFEGDWEPNPPSCEEVVFRVMALSCHLWRVQLEMHSQRESGPSADLTARYRDFSRWMEQESIVERLSPIEKELFDRPLGTWSESDVFENIWRFEALATLLWSIGKFDSMPSYLELVDGQTLMKEACLMGKAEKLQIESSLRPQDEISRQLDVAEFWHWRSRTEMLKKQGMTPPPGETYEATIARAVEYAFSEGIVDEIVDNDVAVDGTAYGSLPHDKWAPLASLSVERHMALSWLAGHAYGNNWDETPTDT